MKRLCVALLIGVAVAAHAADVKPPRRGGGSKQPTQTTDCSNVPVHPYDLILGRPTTNTVTLSVLCYNDAEGYVACGAQSGQLTSRTTTRPLKRGVPAEIVLAPLQANTQYFYQLRLTNPSGLPPSAEGTFHTARPAGASFTFTITADSHLDEHTDPAVYQSTLANALACGPDFHVDLGDTFMTEKHASRENAAKQYLAQRFFFGNLCRSAPLFLALGNHDGESPRGRADSASDDLAVWSNMMRKTYFPNPVPDAFYTGDAAPHPQAGLLQDYYAWQWGDALFVVLDPYWFTQRTRGRGDNWKRTLGDQQYQWLKRTLETSRARYKFVFIHHLVGGLDEQCRGGSEAAPFFEWGGKNLDGTDGLQQNRPGWAVPIHQLLVKNKVNAVFHGHDHIYAKQDLDGIVYQEVPQPGFPNDGKPPRSVEEFGYKTGVIQSSSGFMKVTITPEKSTVEYLRTTNRGPEVSHSYTLSPSP